MNIKEITMSVSRTIQVAPFEPVSFFASITAEVCGEDVTVCYDKLYAIVEKEVGHKVKMAENKKNGLPPPPSKEAKEWAKNMTPTKDSNNNGYSN